MERFASKKLNNRKLLADEGSMSAAMFYPYAETCSNQRHIGI